MPFRVTSADSHSRTEFRSGRTDAVSAWPGPAEAGEVEHGSSGIGPAEGGTGTVRAVGGGGAPAAAESQAPVLVPQLSRTGLADGQVLAGWLRGPYLRMLPSPRAVPYARHYARRLLWEWGLKELAEQVELVVSEIVTNAVRASAGLDRPDHPQAGGASVVRLWLVAGQTSVLVLVWDASPLQPQRQEPEAEAENGRGLLLVETLSAAWGSFIADSGAGKVVWALCQM
jgi:anti-sigma regulatory factor (Ser/Thr protein kinase)